VLLGGTVKRASRTVSGTGITGSPTAVACTVPSADWGCGAGKCMDQPRQHDCNTVLPIGDNRYALTFTLAFDPNSLDAFRLGGSLLVGSSVTVVLDNHPIFTSADNCANLQFATENRSYFRTGENALVFVISNAVGPVGVGYFTASVVSGSCAVAGVSDRHDEDDNNGRAMRDFEDCKDGGWSGLGFRDKGQCVSQHARGGHHGHGTRD
jgi:hypothetical protein